MTQPLQTIEINTNSTIEHSIIWLHGLGADGNDFASVVHMLNIPNTRFVLPHAPYRAITLNHGYEMRAWYDLYGLTLEAKQDAPGIYATQSSIHALITQEIKRGVPAHNIMLAGFSQGGAMALHTALRYPEKLAGVLALSTYLPLSTQLMSEKSKENAKTPIFMAHGKHDDVISLETCQRSRKTLVDQGYAIEFHVYDMAHSVCNDEIIDIRDFILNQRSN